MTEEIRKYLDDLFAKAPKTRAAYDLKEELMANSTERYFDLVEDGVPEKEAFDIVINSIGDIDQLFAAVESESGKRYHDDSLIKKLALYKSIAIGLYIVAIIFGTAVDEFTGYETVGMLGGFLIAAIATCILVYIGAAYPKARYKKGENTVVEEFKEWNSSQKKKKAIRNSIYSILWMVIVTLYLIISFATWAWHVTWIMFLIGGCAQAIANLFFQIKDE